MTLSLQAQCPHCCQYNEIKVPLAKELGSTPYYITCEVCVSEFIGEVLFSISLTVKRKIVPFKRTKHA